MRGETSATFGKCGDDAVDDATVAKEILAEGLFGAQKTAGRRGGTGEVGLWDATGRLG